jgi:hypothetical protein
MISTCSSLVYKGSHLLFMGLYFVLLLGNQKAVGQCTYLSNTDFEDTQIAGSTFQIFNQSTGIISPWKTTASDGAQEVRRSGFSGIPSYSGNQFIELNANIAATTYQNFTAPGGTMFTLNFAHRGRSGTDVMNVSIGSPSPTSIASGTAVTGTTYLNLGNFSDGNTAWGYYTVSFTLPTGVAGDAFSIRFTSVSATGGNTSSGNFLDAISIADIAPAVSGSRSVTLACPTTTTNLNSFTITNPSSGTVRTWHTGAVATNANKIADVTAVGPGTYYTAFYNPTKLCYGGTTSVTVNGPTGVPTAPTVVLTQPVCLLPTGTITIAAPLGASLTYSIDGTNYVSLPVFAGLASGTYAVRVRNGTSSLCTSTSTSATINTPLLSPAAPTASVTVQPSCTLATGTITIAAPTGLGLTYSLDGSTYTNTTGVFTGLSPGIYSVTVKNIAGCISSATSLTVNAQPPTPTVTLSSATICAGSSTTLTVGGCAGGIIKWGSGDNTTSLLVTPVVTTAYSATCIAVSGCTATNSTTITVRPTPTYNEQPTITSATCAGAAANSDAHITLVTLENTERADIVAGGTYNGGPVYMSASNQLVSGGTGSFTNLPNATTRQPYTIRLFGISGTCFIDVMATLDPANCQCSGTACPQVSMNY